MTFEELISTAEVAISLASPLTLTTEELSSITEEQAEELRAKFGAKLMMHLPAHELAFQEWLKIHDEEVWKDLWDHADEPPYSVSLSFLKDMVGDKREGAFYICDLQKAENYFFTPDMLLERESAAFVEAVRDRFLTGGTLTPEQALTVEISAGQTDVWHFAYRRGLDLARAKKAVAALVEDRILVHVPTSDHLSTFFDVG